MTGWNLPPSVTNKMIDDHFGGGEEEEMGILEEKAQEDLEKVKGLGLTWRQLREIANQIGEEYLDTKILMVTRQHDEDEISSEIYMLTEADLVAGLVGMYFAEDPGRGGYPLRDVMDDNGNVHSVIVSDPLLGD
jgi:hypothetical protein